MTDKSNSSSKADDLIDLFADGRGLLAKALASASYHPPVHATGETDLAAAILLHAMSVRENADAVVALARAGLGSTIVVHSRTIFETYVKMVWLTKRVPRATRFFASDPFERYWLATKHKGIKQRAVWKQVLADCRAAVEANPKLLRHQKAGKPSDRPDFLAIAEALRIPDVEDLVAAVGQSRDAYVEDFLIPSLSSHVSVLRLREIPKGVHPDGSVLLNTTVSRDSFDLYLLKTIGWILDCALLVSVALKTKDMMEPLVVAFNDERVTPAVRQFNSSQGAKKIT